MDGGGDAALKPVERVRRLEDLARLAGVSTATVSRALNDSDLISPETKRRVWELARRHAYPVRRPAPTTGGREGKTLALVIPAPLGREARLSDPFYLELVGGIGDAARDRGCDFLVSHAAPGDADALAAVLDSARADGVIFLGQSSLHDHFNALAERDGRFVVWGAALPEQRYCSVGSDNLKGGARATAHLARLGRRRIAFLGDTEAPELQQRLQGYRDALAEAGLPFDTHLVQPAHFDLESAAEAVDFLAARGVAFDGVVAASDMIALGAIRALVRRGRRVPEDVSVVGYDDLAIARYNHPALTTVRQDVGKGGVLLVSKLMTLVNGGAAASERLPTELVVRESCGA
jgi:DNA-binding LacI/PurR family transcriptional regulator